MSLVLNAVEKCMIRANPHESSRLWGLPFVRGNSTPLQVIENKKLLVSISQIPRFWLRGREVQQVSDILNPRTTDRTLGL
jgi:hypothetical protein